MKYFWVISLLVFLTFAINLVYPLRCYECKLVEQSRCVQKVNLPMHHCFEPNVTMEELIEAKIHAVCIKTTKQSKLMGNPYLYTNRTCGLYDGKEDSCRAFVEREKRETGATLSCHVCYKDLCNQSSFTSHHVSAVLISVVFVAIFYKFI